MIYASSGVRAPYAVSLFYYAYSDATFSLLLSSTIRQVGHIRVPNSNVAFDFH